MPDEFYNGFAEYYHRHIEATGRRDVRFYTELYRNVGNPVLEIGCGTGRTLIPCAEAGAVITGLDLSEDMLSFCKSSIEASEKRISRNITLVNANMADFNLERKFKLITTPFRPFQHLATVEEQLSCLTCIHNHLESGGTFVLDLFDPDMDILTDTERVLEFGEEPPFFMKDGREVTVSYRNPSVDSVMQIVHCEIIFSVRHPNGTRERLVQQFVMRYTFRWEAEHLLARTGFRIKSVQGGYNREQVGAGELVFFAEKNE
jgi:SAM-dependent methyltransferase